ncbi:MAG: extracellular solute-binding protein family 1 [Leifsonia sp.]|nr:extracellular solute-binding protein family 1 [Leifsonia sp.]MDQ1587374.1 iron(III) transport system substrate-binding protein [Microbacteriaceae bacterium]HEV7565475.1 extracellular solute-binding protein [Microbacteriaceae bacterium]
MIRTQKLAVSAALAVASIAALAGCSSTASAASPSGSAAVEPLVLYSAIGYDAAIAKAFTAASGIPVKVVDDSTGPLLTKIAAEKNNPQWGAFMADGATAFAALDQGGQLLPYTTTASVDSVGTSLTPSDHSYIPMGTTVVAALIYNAAATTAVPTSYNDLLTPAYKGKVGMNDPAQSGPTYPFIAGLMNQLGGTKGGVAAGEAYLTKLKANGLVVNPTNGDTLHALETGQINYGLIQSSAAMGEVVKFTAKPVAGYDPKVIYLSKSTLLPSAYGIDKAASPVQQSEAKKFIDYILSPAGQKVAQGADPAGDSLYWPVVNGVTPLAPLPATVPSSSQAIDPTFWGPLQGQVVTWFDSNIK